MMDTDQLFEDSPYFAAIDLGSNSFHLLVIKMVGGAIETIDRVKEMVQIARGLNNTKELSADAQQRAIDCLQRFHERIRDIPKTHIRVVGTKALRSASNAREFLQEAEKALGHRIDIISGYEEARLVYLGVSHDISEDKGRRLVIDIGGASTEVIIGDGESTLLLESLSIGCVTYSDLFFTQNNGFYPEKITARMISQVYYSACEELEYITQACHYTGWSIAVGSSGTMRAVAQLMDSKVMTGVITKEGVAQLVDKLRSDGYLGELSEDISPKRQDVLPAGIIILSAIFDQLKLENIHVVDATLKEGLIYDTLGRLSAKDIREQTIDKMMSQYRVDQQQAWRVNETFNHFSVTLPSPIINGVNVKYLFHWAALLHEIGLHISHSKYHHHGHYLIQKSDMGGFSRFEQELLALLVGSHRRKIRSEGLVLLTANHQQALYPLLVALRLAILLNHCREEASEIPKLSVTNNSDQGLLINLQFSPLWLERHPLTHHKLVREQQYLKPLNIELDCE